VPKARARVISRAGKTRAVTPTKTLQWEAHARLMALAARSREPGWRTDALSYGVQIEIRRSVRRGDVDNFAKACLDACNGIVWVDDARVTRLSVEIFEVLKGDEAVLIRVWVID
jgi:Holliday junction resolvase RusA-like endonuclease